MIHRALPLTFGALLSARTVYADQGPVELAWAREDSAARCPDGEALRAEVRERLQRDVFAEGAPNVIEGVARREGTTWTAQLVVRDRVGSSLGRRELSRTGDDCGALADAVALAVTLAIDPEYVSAPTQRPQRPRQARAAVAALAPRGAVRTRATLHPELAAGAAVIRGVVPGAAPAVVLEALIPLRPRWHVSLGATWIPSRDDPESPLELGATLGHLGVCGAPLESARLTLRACAGLRAGAVHLAVRDATPGEVGDHAWVALDAGIRGAVRVVGPVILGAGVGASIPFWRNRFVRDPSGQRLFVQDVVAVSVALTLGVRVP